MAEPKRHSRGRRVREAATARYAPSSTEEELTGIVFDSDVIIEVLRGRPKIVKAVFELEESGIPTYCTAISYAEIFAGIRAGEEAPTQAFFHARGEVVLDGIAGRQAGDYIARFKKSHNLELADALIAAAATTSGLQLWTLNRRHYPMPDLRFYEPTPRGRESEY